MRAFAGVTSLCVALMLSGCGQSAPQVGAASSDLELGEIEATTRDLSDDKVTVELRWTIRQVAPNETVSELPPVFLFNEASDIRAIVEPDPDWIDGEIRFEAAVDVPKEAWQSGCWQADYRIDGLVASRDIICLNAKT